MGTGFEGIYICYLFVGQLGVYNGFVLFIEIGSSSFGL